MVKSKVCKICSGKDQDLQVPYADSSVFHSCISFKGIESTVADGYLKDSLKQRTIERIFSGGAKLQEYILKHIQCPSHDITVEDVNRFISLNTKYDNYKWCHLSDKSI